MTDDNPSKRLKLNDNRSLASIELLAVKNMDFYRHRCEDSWKSLRALLNGKIEESIIIDELMDLLSMFPLDSDEANELLLSTIRTGCMRLDTPLSAAAASVATHHLTFCCRMLFKSLETIIFNVGDSSIVFQTKLWLFLLDAVCLALRKKLVPTSTAQVLIPCSCDECLRLVDFLENPSQLTMSVETTKEKRFGKKERKEKQNSFLLD
jgi:hypothetical protein